MSQISLKTENQSYCQRNLYAFSVSLCVVSGVALAVILVISKSANFYQAQASSICLLLSGVALQAFILTVLTKLSRQKQNVDQSEVNFSPSVQEKSTEKRAQNKPYKWGYIKFCLEHELRKTDYSDNYIGPDDSDLANLFLQCQNPDIKFISRADRSCSAFYVEDKNQIEMLVNKIKSAFCDGKKMAFAILSTGRHAIAAGFSQDGSFVIVDSMLSSSVDVESLSRSLNAAKIKDNKQNNIVFRGRFFNTHIQKAGHECLRFATLYCYHMAICEDLTAFEEVNGAFYTGRLRTFEDHKKIAGSPRIRSLKGKRSDYRTFMLSWLYRSFGLTVDAWWELSVNELIKLQNFEFKGEMFFCYLTKSCLPDFYDSSQFIFEITSPDSQRTQITPEVLSKLDEVSNPELDVPMEEALVKDDQSYLLVFLQNDTQPHLFLLKQNEKIECLSIEALIEGVSKKG